MWPSPAVVGDAPDRAAAVFADEERAVPSNGDAHRAGPDISVADHEAGQEILVFAGRLAVVQQSTDYLVPSPLGAVPGAVKGGEDVAAVVGRKLRALVEGHFHRGRMRLHQYVRHSYPAAQSGLLSLMPRIFIGSDIEPRPAIECTLADPGKIVGRKVVAEAVALVDRAPQLAGPGLDRHADAVAQARRKGPFVLALRREGKDDGAALVRLPRRIDPAIGGVAARADRDEHAAAIGREDDVARPVSASRQSGDDRLCRAGGLEIPRAVGKANDTVGVRDIDIARVRSRRPEGDAEGLVEVFSESVDLRRLGAIRGAQYPDPSRATLGDKDVAARRHAHQARVVETAGEEVNGEAGWRFRPGIGRTLNDGRV